MSKGKLILLVGIPFSGKTTVGKEMGVVYSKDEMKQSLKKDYTSQQIEDMALEILKSQGIKMEGLKDSRQKQLINQAKKKLVETALHRQIEKALDSGQTVVYNACNVSKKKRRKILDEFAGKYNSAMAVYVKTPLSKALERNSKAPVKEPIKTIKRMDKNLEVPDESEGFDEIAVIEN